MPRHQKRPADPHSIFIYPGGPDVGYDEHSGEQRTMANNVRACLRVQSEHPPMKGVRMYAMFAYRAGQACSPHAATSPLAISRSDARSNAFCFARGVVSAALMPS